MLIRQRWLGLIPLLLLACWLGASWLNTDILFVDEYWSIRNSGGAPFGPLDMAGIWNSTAYVDPGGMGVLYHWLLAGWQALIGSSAYSIRAFSLLSGILAIAGVYRLGADLFTQKIGFYAAVVLGTSAFFVEYLHEGRAYTLIVLLTIAALYSYYRAMLRDDVPSRGWYVALALIVAALAYTHYVALAVGAALGIFHLLNFRRSARWYWTLGALLLGAVLFLPWVGVTLEVVRRGTIDTNRQDTSLNSIEALQNLLYTFSNANIALLALCLLFAVRVHTRRAYFVAMWCGVSLALALIVNAIIPFMVNLRYLLLLWVPLALIVALGIDRINRAGIAAGVMLLVWGGAGLYQSLNPAFIEDQFGQIYRQPAAGFHAARDMLNVRAQPGDMALFHIIPPGYEPFNYFVLGYYMDETPFRYDQIERMNNTTAGSDNEYLPDIRASLGDAGAVWTLINPVLPTTQRSNIVDYVLRTEYLTCGVVLSRADMETTLYVRPVHQSPHGTFTAADGGAVSVWDVQRGGQIGGSYSLALAWDIDGRIPPQRYSIAVQLTAENGVPVTQADIPLPDVRPQACTHLSLPLDNVPAGEYALNLIVYDWQTGERLTVRDGDMLPLNPVTVRP